jgi:hypothetical protein
MKHLNQPDQGVPRSAPLSMEGLLPPAQLGASGLCDLYCPGHQIHYKHQADAAGSTPRAVRETLLDGTLVTLLLEDGDVLRWSNHDGRRLGRILELVSGQGTAYPQFHALRIGPYWFNCATESDHWQDCRLSLAADEA